MPSSLTRYRYPKNVTWYGSLSEHFILPPFESGAACVKADRTNSKRLLGERVVGGQLHQANWAIQSAQSTRPCGPVAASTEGVTVIRGNDPRSGRGSGTVVKDARCQHGFKAGECGYCAASSSRVVYVSGGGHAYHLRRDCENLLQGKRVVDERGGTTATVRVTREDLALAEGRRRCRLCVVSSRRR